MTKSDIERFVRRYSKIKQSIKRKEAESCFYVGNRKKQIPITEEVIALYETVEEIYLHIKNEWTKKLIGGILNGKSDVSLFQQYPCSRTLYYAIKREFIETIYRCCIAKQMVTYEELLTIGIFK